MKLKAEDSLNCLQKNQLLDALLFGVKPNGVRMILESYIKDILECLKREDFVANLTDTKPARKIEIIRLRHADIEELDDKLDVLEELYNTIDEWGVE